VEEPGKIPVVVAPATVVSPVAARATVAPDTVVASPVTTQEQDRVTLGQRRINVLWEVTQAIVAVLVTAVTLACSATLIIRGEKGAEAFLLMSNAFFVVISTYLTRTNHTKTGGVGPNETGR